MGLFLVLPAFICLQSLFLLCWLIPAFSWQDWIRRAAAVNNLLLIPYAILLWQQLWSFYHAYRYFAAHIPPGHSSMIPYDMLLRLGAMSLLPFFSLLRRFRENLYFSLLLLLLVVWQNPPFTWNLYAIELKIPAYLSLFCAVYGLLWLLKQLPQQRAH
ncbi:MAG TPA: hypothetical protein VG842_00510 [Sediminibacterium sp.]|nr:hypothetical protein [Sediminibacterium sp.]